MKTLGNLAQAFVDERRTQLNCYLQAIFRLPAVLESPELRSALSLAETGVTLTAKKWLDGLQPSPSSSRAAATIWDQGPGSFITELAVSVRSRYCKIFRCRKQRLTNRSLGSAVSRRGSSMSSCFAYYTNQCPVRRTQPD
jgi:hypothetical protein